MRWDVDTALFWHLSFTISPRVYMNIMLKFIFPFGFELIVCGPCGLLHATPQFQYPRQLGQLLQLSGSAKLGSLRSTSESVRSKCDKIVVIFCPLVETADFGSWICSSDQNSCSVSQELWLSVEAILAWIDAKIKGEYCNSVGMNGPSWTTINPGFQYPVKYTNTFDDSTITKEGNNMSSALRCSPSILRARGINCEPCSVASTSLC